VNRKGGRGSRGWTRMASRRGTGRGPQRYAD